jgi:hypothetical protein
MNTKKNKENIADVDRIKGDRFFLSFFFSFSFHPEAE